MSIIGILAALAVGSFRTAQVRGRDAQRKSDLKQISHSLELFYADYGKYPNASGGKISACPYDPGLASGSVCTWGSSEMTDGRTTYFKVVPKDPTTNQSYTYEVVSGSSNQKYKLFATIAGHMGDGNFHIIPLMKIEDPKERAKLEPAMKEVNNLVLKYGGSVSGEHNDGMVRGPWLKDMYGEEVLGYMKEVKTIFDPQNIFNPHKKTDADWDFSFSHIREKF